MTRPMARSVRLASGEAWAVMDHAHTGIPSRNVRIIPADRHAEGKARHGAVPDLGLARDSNDPKSGITIGDVGKASTYGHTPSLARRVVMADLNRMSRVDDRDDAQPGSVGGDISGVPAHGYAICRARRVAVADGPDLQ